MPGIVILTVFITLVSICFLWAFTAYLSRCNHRLTLFEAYRLLRRVDQREFLTLMNPLLDGTLSMVFDREQLLASVRGRLFEAQEYFGRADHNARIFLIVGRTVLWQELKENPGMEHSEEFIRAGRELMAAAIQLRLYTLVTLGRTRFWLALRTQWWFPGPVPNLSRLSYLPLARIPFLPYYEKFREKAGQLCLCFEDGLGQELYEEIMPLL